MFQVTLFNDKFFALIGCDLCVFPFFSVHTLQTEPHNSVAFISDPWVYVVSREMLCFIDTWF